MTALDQATDDRLRAFIEFGLPYRELVVSISRADERRLARQIAAYNQEAGGSEDWMDATDDEDLAIIFAGAALRGMDANDTDEGVWTDLDGVARKCPRPNRAPRRKRLKYAWQSARRTWRAT